jgi:hypothetical protein
MPDNDQLQARLTVVTTTHLHPGAPSTHGLERTVRSLRRKLEVAQCEHVVYYDAPKTGGDHHTKYLSNLQRLCEKYGLTLLVREGVGLKGNYLHAVGTVSTPYMLFVEHDWLFRRSIDVVSLLDVFDKYEFVNIVRLNRRGNDWHCGWDHIVEPEDRISEVKLTRTSAWSNHPHIVRLAKWRQDWRTIVGDEPGRGPDGVEDKLYWAYGKDIFTEGFRVAHAKWGSFLWGPIDQGPVIRHTGRPSPLLARHLIILSTSRLVQPLAKVTRRPRRTLRRVTDRIHR